MKAFRIHQFGANDLAALDETPAAQPDANQVSVRVMASSVNPLDLKIIAGYMQQVFPVTFPYTVGTDFAGVIDAIGANVGNLRPGARVFGRLAPTAGGAFAEQLVVPFDSVCTMPDAMSFEQGAALPTTAGTSILALLEIGKLKAGQRVLIHAGAGGVGSIAVQIAKEVGAHVIATASAKNGQLVRDLGADEVIDYRTTDFSAQLSGVDLVLDTVGGETLEKSWKVVRPGGAIVSIADHTIESRGGVSGTFAFYSHHPGVLESIRERFAAQRLQVVIDAIHSLDEARSAIQHVASGHSRGKVIVRPSR